MGALLLAVVLLYTYFVAFSIAHVVEREEYVHKTAIVSEEVSRLEKEYLARSGQLTENSALALGLLPVESKSFVERRTFTFRTER